MIMRKIMRKNKDKISHRELTGDIGFIGSKPGNGINSPYWK